MIRGQGAVTITDMLEVILWLLMIAKMLIMTTKRLCLWHKHSEKRGQILTAIIYGVMVSNTEQHHRPSDLYDWIQCCS